VTVGRPADQKTDPAEETFQAMIEVPQWFLFVFGVALFATAHRRRQGIMFPPEGSEDIR
jgi:hypothetical protein